jgi:ketosteroid isomerase-like protein
MQCVLALALTVTVTLSSIAVHAAQDDPLSAVKAAYVATEYEEALALLSSMNGGVARDQADVYRALCLLALGRMNDVTRVLQALAARNPSYRLSESEVPPRLVALFADVRRRQAQAEVTDSYARAKAAFDAQRFADASAQFSGVLSLFTTYAAVLDPNDPATRDLPQLAGGFRDLADAEIARAKALTQAAVAPALVTPAPVAAAPRPEMLIESVVQRYALAYSALDAGAVVRVFPGENVTVLKSAFSRLKSQAIDPRNVTVTLGPAGDSATVTMTWVVQAAPKIGSTIKAERPTTLRMVRNGDGSWTIAERR